MKQLLSPFPCDFGYEILSSPLQVSIYLFTKKLFTVDIIFTAIIIFILIITIRAIISITLVTITIITTPIFVIRRFFFCIVFRLIPLKIFSGWPETP
ncbi:hypothetical protein PRUPE_2G146100 [Prunus persica]|uniref:Uncharacterized protein n=1 Tax=Prunus persica TaxID=3760 RepID=A0A251QFT2_PRUPE|nr:hypothetical protein PRUPE_2G146100 [Prunus persica]